MPSGIEQVNRVAPKINAITQEVSKHSAFIKGGLEKAMDAVEQVANGMVFCTNNESPNILYVVANPSDQSGAFVNHPQVMKVTITNNEKNAGTVSLTAKNGGDFSRETSPSNIIESVTSLAQEFFKKIIKGDLVPLDVKHEVKAL